MKRLSTVHYAAIGLILISLLMNYVYFNNTGKTNSPIIEYEFVKTQQDVKNIFIENNEFKKDEINGIRDQNITDYIYMIIYSSFLILVFVQINKIENKKIFNLGIVFSLSALISDVFENIQMFRISELMVNRIDFSEPVKILFIITRLKWLCLTFAMLLMSFHYYKYKFLGKLFALLSALPLITVLAYIIFKDTENDFVNFFTKFIMLDFVILMLWVFISVKINNKINFYKTEQ